MSKLWIVVVVMVLACASWTLAWAQEPAEGTDPAVTADEGYCQACVEAGGLCEDCKAEARAFLTELSAEMCPDCTEDELCEACAPAVNKATEMLLGLEAGIVSLDPTPIAYMEGNVTAEMPELIGKVVELGFGQGLFNDDTLVALIYPFVMAEGYSPEMVYYAGVTLAADAKVKEPLEVYEVPGGDYLRILHIGAYDGLGLAWMAGFAYAYLHDIELGDGPSGELYLNDPGSTPEEELLTEIYIPLAMEEEETVVDE